MAKIKKINCPSDVHRVLDYKKILCFYKLGKRKNVEKLWIRCDSNCRRWIQIVFNGEAAKVEVMPKGVRFLDVEERPVIVMGK